MNEQQVKAAIPDLLRNWSTTHDVSYAQSIPNSDLDRTLYRLEKDQAPDQSWIPTTWIARTLRTKLGVPKEVVTATIGVTVEELVREGILEQQLSQPLDPNYTIFSGPLSEQFQTGRRYVRLVASD